MSSTFGVEFENRSGAIITAQADLAFRPLRWKAAASGGPVESEIQATGTRAGLKSLRDWLRYPVAIYNPNGSIVWWGFVYEVALQLDGWSISATLDKLRNRVLTESDGDNRVAVDKQFQSTPNLPEDGVKTRFVPVGKTQNFGSRLEY